MLRFLVIDMSLPTMPELSLIFLRRQAISFERWEASVAPSRGATPAATLTSRAPPGSPFSALLLTLPSDAHARAQQHACVGGAEYACA